MWHRRRFRRATRSLNEGCKSSLAKPVAKMEDQDSLKRMQLKADGRSFTPFWNDAVYNFSEDMWRFTGTEAILTSLDNTVSCVHSKCPLQLPLRSEVPWNGSKLVFSSAPIFETAFTMAKEIPTNLTSSIERQSGSPSPFFFSRATARSLMKILRQPLHGRDGSRSAWRTLDVSIGQSVSNLNARSSSTALGKTSLSHSDNCKWCPVHECHFPNAPMEYSPLHHHLHCAICTLYGWVIADSSFRPTKFRRFSVVLSEMMTIPTTLHKLLLTSMSNQTALEKVRKNWHLSKIWEITLSMDEIDRDLDCLYLRCAGEDEKIIPSISI